MKKAFLVTGLSNALGGHEDRLIRNDDFRKEIDEIIGEILGIIIWDFSQKKNQMVVPSLVRQQQFSILQ